MVERKFKLVPMETYFRDFSYNVCVCVRVCLKERDKEKERTRNKKQQYDEEQVRTNERDLPVSHEKNPLTFHCTDCLIGILIMVYYNPHVTG